ncbi:MAG TPA: AbrB/MazE/SpoVT family DNA-binding domain-containing protein [Candidatus Nanoarchaeia archaeon]|nr:AbrB/MazE/SpoVT family DNA-binding domain-containing protein [Candidatus Nanoarchaeia archaeon]
MKKFMETCYKCKSAVKPSQCIKEGITLNCLKCSRCGEEYLTSSELIKFDIKTGRRKLIRKFGILGDSTFMRLPIEVVKQYKIKPGDYGLFEKRPEGILIKPVHARDIKG